MRSNVDTTAARGVLSVDGLRAYYRTRHFGIEREVRAVDGVDLAIGRNEIYGLAGESSCGKSTLIKTIAGAIAPPLDVLAGSVRFIFNGREVDIYASGRAEIDAIRWRT